MTTSFEAIRAGRRPDPRRFDVDGLGALLELSLGLTAWKQYGANRWALRANPSSGNLHPTEGYLVVPSLPGIGAGVYHYVSRDHALERRSEPVNAAQWNAALSAGVVVGLSGIHWREAWKYGVRAFRYCQHDCGHAIAAVAYAAAALGWHVRVIDAWSDDELACLLALDRDADFADAEREAPEAAMWITPDAAAAPPEVRVLETRAAPGRANRLSPEHVEWAGIDEVQLAVRRPAGPTDARASRAWPPRPAAPAQAAAAALIRQRRSAVDFDGTTTLSAARWFDMLDALLPRDTVPPFDAWPWPARVHPVLLVHRVDGATPGLYALVRDRDATDRLASAMRPEFAWLPVDNAPAHLPLYLLAAGDARDAARSICCHQDIAADGCFAVAFLAEFAEPIREAPWFYRALFWETGLLGQALYLEAEAAGIRGTGIGCFFDEATHDLVGVSTMEWRSLYHFTVGGPVDDARLQTHPPYAHLARAR
ncbi:MAG: nitroreductase [Acidobacteriota bacterium]